MKSGAISENDMESESKIDMQVLRNSLIIFIFFREKSPEMFNVRRELC